MEEKNTDQDYLECEKFWIFLMMIGVGGFLGAYTFVLKGGVFCNAQTANFVLLALHLGQGHWAKAGYFLIPISAYLAGAILSEFLPKRINRWEILRWDTFFVGFEMICFLLIGLVPDDAPPQFCQIFVNFVASMQYNTFRQAKGVSLATTFCTNHLRQVGIHTVKWFRKKNPAALVRLKMHGWMLGAFVAGGIASAFLCGWFQGKTIWWAELLLLIVFLDLLRADLSYEKDRIHQVPHGH